MPNNSNYTDSGSGQDLYENRQRDTYYISHSADIMQNQSNNHLSEGTLSLCKLNGHPVSLFGLCLLDSGSMSTLINKCVVPPNEDWLMTNWSPPLKAYILQKNILMLLRLCSQNSVKQEWFPWYTYVPFPATIVKRIGLIQCYLTINSYNDYWYNICNLIIVDNRLDCHW